MKILLLSAALLAIIPAAAHAAPPTKEQIHEACTGYSGFGEMVATYRQNNIPKEDVISSFDEIENLPAQEKQAMVQMAEIAYTADIQTSEEDRKGAVESFRAAIYEACSEDLAKQQ